MRVSAFISCRFPPAEAVGQICDMLRPEIEPYVSGFVKSGSLPMILRDEIAGCDCVIAIVTDQGPSAFIQAELGIALALNKPVFAIYDEKVEVDGIQPYLSTFATYKSDDVASAAKHVVGLKRAAAREAESREISGSPEEQLRRGQKNGLVGVYRDRASAFDALNDRWNRESQIVIVGSSIDGLNKSVGVDARDLLRERLKKDDQVQIRVLLTHPSFASFREKPERVPDKSIAGQIRATAKMLAELHSQTNAGDRLRWKYFKAPPTCFMIVCGDFILLNPYLYMQPAYCNFALIFNNTGSVFDIYHHYYTNHFDRPWNDPDLSVTSIEPEIDAR